MGGGAKLDDKGNLVGPSYTVDGKKVGNLGDAITNIDGRTAGNSKNITELTDNITNGKAGLVRLDAVGNAVFSEGLGKDKAFHVGNRAVTGVKPAKLDAKSTDAVNGSQLFAANRRLALAEESIDKHSVMKISSDGNKIVIAEKAVKAKSLSLGNRKIEDVKDGEISVLSKDAINGSQLHASNERIKNNSARIKKVENDFGKMEARVNGLDKRIEHNRKHSSAGIAGAMALASIPYVYSEEVSFGMGVAAYDDQSAISAGFNFKSSERSAVRINYSLDTQNSMGIGVGFAFGF
ncbi:hypothetical protein AYJ10_18635 [Serratia marcescens]|nr:hypothetical protein AYJ10_18635 [Serratia marcescens]